MGLAFARQGHVVFNVDYRLAPDHPYPAAMQDCCEAYLWVLKNAEKFGGDPSRIVLAGESAGANLALSVTLATVLERPEPWAKKVYDAGVVPLATLPACGMLQVSDCERFSRKRTLPTWLQDRLDEVAEAYLGDATADSLADPLLVLENLEKMPDRGLPPMFASVGTKDTLLDDTRRLEAAITRLGGVCDAKYYPGEIHAFHAFLWRKQARECWMDHFDFLDRHT